MCVWYFKYLAACVSVRVCVCVRVCVRVLLRYVCCMIVFHDCVFHELCWACVLDFPTTSLLHSGEQYYGLVLVVIIDAIIFIHCCLHSQVTARNCYKCY